MKTTDKVVSNLISKSNKLHMIVLYEKIRTQRTSIVSFIKITAHLAVIFINYSVIAYGSSN